MKVVIAQMEHETNTFSPIATEWKHFGKNGPYLGKDVIAEMSKTMTPIGAFINLSKKNNFEIVTPISGFAYPSGPVTQNTYQKFCQIILDSIDSDCDLLLMDFHGAMVVDNTTDDPEGDLLKKIREKNKNIPIGCSLDLHANVTPNMVKYSDVIVGYSTYPHIDMYETGSKVFNLIIDRIRKKIINNTLYHINIPILAQTLRMDTSTGAMRKLINFAKSYENDKTPSISIFGGFPQADTFYTGMSCIINTYETEKEANILLKKINDYAYSLRDDFLWFDDPLEKTLIKAKSKEASKPILLIDHSDNCASGGTQDTMTVLEKCIEQDLRGIAVGPIRDPETVDKLFKYDIDTESTIRLGGKNDMPLINLKGKPLRLSGKLINKTNGEYTITGPQFTGIKAFMGRTVVFETINAQIVICENLQEPWDIGVFESVGINPKKKKFLLLKSRMYFKPIFQPISDDTFYCKGNGVTSSDWKIFNYKKIRQPIYPLSL